MSVMVDANLVAKLVNEPAMHVVVGLISAPAEIDAGGGVRLTPRAPVHEGVVKDVLSRRIEVSLVVVGDLRRRAVSLARAAVGAILGFPWIAGDADIQVRGNSVEAV